MTISLWYKRYFLQSSASRGTNVTVITEIYFQSPFYPSLDTWFTNIGDNLGGSDSVTGPLKNISSTMTSTNIWMSNPPGKAFFGNNGNTGCMRIWSNKNFAYPMGDGYAEQNYWRPINPNMLSSIRLEAVYQVTSGAVSGTRIGAANTIVSPSATNFTPSCIMATIGSDFQLLFNYSIPAGASLTLDII